MSDLQKIHELLKEVNENISSEKKSDKRKIINKLGEIINITETLKNTLQINMKNK